MGCNIKNIPDWTCYHRALWYLYIEMDMPPSDSFMSILYSQLGMFTWDFRPCNWLSLPYLVPGFTTWFLYVSSLLGDLVLYNSCKVSMRKTCFSGFWFYLYQWVHNHINTHNTLKPFHLIFTSQIVPFCCQLPLNFLYPRILSRPDLCDAYWYP